MPLPFDSLIVFPWTDPVVDAVGHDPRSPYVEQFWLGILGPSTTWLLRRLAAAFDRWPDGFELDLSETAGALGLSATSGRHSPFARTLQRCVQFGLAQPQGRGMAVRRRLPPLSQRQLGRLPAGVQSSHADWVKLHLDSSTDLERARLIARAMLQAGDAAATAEEQLHRVGVPAPVAASAVEWAVTNAA
ncbi:MAG TPA: hypothetical protein VKD67_09170 [Acidimicrobiales bacterium]|nr:hypothetical protein [Acidimicrobiales bacterium]